MMTTVAIALGNGRVKVWFANKTAASFRTFMHRNAGKGYAAEALFFALLSSWAEYSTEVSLFPEGAVLESKETNNILVNSFSEQSKARIYAGCPFIATPCFTKQAACSRCGCNHMRDMRKY